MGAAAASRIVFAFVIALALGGCSMADLLSEDGLASAEIPAPLEPKTDTGQTAVQKASAAVRGPDTSLNAQQDFGDRLALRTLDRSARSANKPLERKLNEIAARLAEHIDGNPFKYRVYLIEDPRANAFTPGGGHLFISTGLVSVLKSEGQMAMVLAHEMGHNIRAHVVRGEHGRAIARDASMFSKRVFDKKLGLPWLAKSIGFLVKTSLNSYTREQEDQADELGLDYIVAAGYDPFEAARTFTNLMNARKDQPELVNFFFGDHPTSEMRVWRLGNLIKAKYGGIDLDWRVRSTPGYDLLAARYWNQFAAHAALPEN